MMKILFLKKFNTARIFWSVFATLFVNCSYAQQSSPSTNSQPTDAPAMKADTPDQQLFFAPLELKQGARTGKQTALELVLYSITKLTKQTKFCLS